MKYLFVVAHPDDEVLGGGATIHKLVMAGDIVDCCIVLLFTKKRGGREKGNRDK